MTLPVANLVKAAVETIYSAFADDKTAVGTRAGVEALALLSSKLNPLYPVVDIIITADDDDAGVSEFIAAESTMAVGVVLRKQGTASYDLLDNAFATAKGSALADNDIFVLDGADSVEYLGNNIGFAFDFDGETREDFVSIGS